MSSERGRIQITGFESETVDEREKLSEWSEDKSAEVRSRWVKVFQKLIHDRLALFGGTVVGTMLIVAIFVQPIEAFGITIQPLSLTPHDPGETLIMTETADIGAGEASYHPPTFDPFHPMGTDRIGRDVFSRVMVGTRYSVTIGIIVTAISATFGVIYGGISGYFGGKIDDVLMRFVDMIFAFPGLVLAIVIITMLGRGYWQLVAAFALVGWAFYGRLIRGEILKVKQNEYVLAAKALGARDSRVLFRHIVPNAIAPVIVQATLSIGTVVIGVAALGFLGVGFSGETAEWGTMLNAERETIVSASDGWTRWWVTIFPGIMIFIFVMGMNMVGDAVNDALDAQAETNIEQTGGG